MSHSESSPHAGHGHTHNHHHPTARFGQALFLNLAFALVEWVGGVLTNSVSILSDALHDTGDALALAMAWYLEGRSKKPGDRQFTFGYRRLSILSALILSTILLVGSGFVVAAALGRLKHPEGVHAPGMIALAVVGIGVNALAAWRMRGRGLHDRAVALHFIEDVMGWLAVLIGAIVMAFTGWSFIDPILSIAIAAFIAFNALKNARGALLIFLMGRPAEPHEGELSTSILATKGVAGIHDIHLWTLDGEYHVLTAHVEVSGNPDLGTLMRLKKKLRHMVGELGVAHATFEMETSGAPCGLRDCRRP